MESALMQLVRKDHPLRRLFAGLVEQAFCAEVGVCDPGLTDYMAGLLVDFTHVDRLNAIRNAQGRRLDQIAAMLSVSCDDQPVSPAERDRTMYRHIGDFTLFWAGLYPEQLKRTSPSDVLLDYVTNGKRSYAIVSELARENEQPPASLFRHLSDEFETCLHGLGLVRRSWEQRDLGRADRSGGLVY